MSEPYTFTIRTPQAVVFEGPLLGVRVPSETGLVGLRPGAEPMVLVVIAGLVVLRSSAGERFAASAGGLLHHDRTSATLLTPFAVVGSSEEAMLAELAEMFATPGSELSARRQLLELESRILREVRQQPNAPPSAWHHD